MRKVFFFGFILIYFTHQLQAQGPNDFSNDPATFIKQAEQLLTDTKRDDAKEVARQLVESWAGFSSNQQSGIMDIANAMRQRKMLVTPYFQKYFSAVVAFRQSKRDEDFFDSWKEMEVRHR